MKATKAKKTPKATASVTVIPPSEGKAGKVKNVSGDQSEGGEEMGENSSQVARLHTHEGFILAAISAAVSQEELQAKIVELLSAKRVYVNKNGEKLEVDDFSTQLATVRFIADYMEGRPIERQLTLTKPAPASLDDVVDKLKQSPVFRDQVRDMLNEAEKTQDVSP